MNREEAIKFLALVKVAYPNSYKDMDNASKQATVNMWQISFPNTPFVIMTMAFDNFRRKSTFPPTVAEINEELRKLNYKAVADMISAKQRGDEERYQKAKYVRDVTSEFDKIETRINYGNLNVNMIDAYYEERKLLT